MTGTPALAACHAASHPASPAPAMWMGGILLKIPLYERASYLRTTWFNPVPPAGVATSTKPKWPNRALAGIAIVPLLTV